MNSFLVCTICFHNADGEPWGSDSSGGGGKSNDMTKFRKQLLNEIQAFKEEKDHEMSEIKDKLQGKGAFTNYVYKTR
jgi:hypothetical protein